MSWLERKFIGMISSRLLRFNEKSDGFNFRCPVCGDSKKNEMKARGWLLEGDGANPYRFYCFNCQASESFSDFLKHVSIGLHNDYITEKFRESGKDKSERRIVPRSAPAFAPRPKPVEVVPSPRPFPCLKTLDEADWAKEYIESRKIPAVHHSQIFACDNISRLAASIPAYADKRMSSSKCIVFPFYGVAGVIAYLQCRVLDGGDFRYMTFELEGGVKIWGGHSFKADKPIFLFEGPIDGMCVENGAASGGSDLITAAKGLKEAYPESTPILCFDADWRTNRAVYCQLEKAIQLGLKVSIPKMPGKDVNDCVMAGMTVAETTAMMSGAVYQGLTAKLNLSTVKKPWK